MATGDIHRIGGGGVENLRLKSQEAKLTPPGISVLKAPTPEAAARQIREAFPEALALHRLADVIGTTTLEAIRGVGFDLLPNPTRKLPNHHRIVHPEGSAGFHDESLKRLSEVFTDTRGL